MRNANSLHKIGDLRRNPMILMQIFDVASSVLSQQERSRLCSMFGALFCGWKLHRENNDKIGELFRFFDYQIGGNDALARWMNCLFVVINSMIDNTIEDDVYVEVSVSPTGVDGEQFSGGTLLVKVYNS